MTPAQIAKAMRSDDRIESLLEGWAGENIDNGELVKRMSLLRDEVSLRGGVNHSQDMLIAPLPGDASEAEDEHATFGGCGAV